MLFPKKVKHRKWQTARRNPNKKTVATRGISLAFGSFGLKAMTPARITSNQIEAARKVLRRGLGKNGRMWVRIFPDRPYTEKAAETPMGKGKGDPQGFVAIIEPGRVVFEVDGITESEAREALRKSAAKLPISARVVARS